MRGTIFKVVVVVVVVLVLAFFGYLLARSMTGANASTHTVDLSWNASTSADVCCYNVYRAVYTNSCGSFSKINSVLITSTWYTDSEVMDGTSYCYATTAVNTSNEESAYSNIVSNVQIPTS